MQASPPQMPGVFSTQLAACGGVAEAPPLSFRGMVRSFVLGELSAYTLSAFPLAEKLNKQGTPVMNEKKFHSFQNHGRQDDPTILTAKTVAERSIIHDGSFASNSTPENIDRPELLSQ